MTTEPPQRPPVRGKTAARVQPPSGQPKRAPRKTAARSNDAKVIPLRAGDQQKAKVSNLTCRHCGCPWWKAVVTIDRVTHKPGVVMTEGGAVPNLVCAQCGRQPRL